MSEVKLDIVIRRLNSIENKFEDFNAKFKEFIKKFSTTCNKLETKCSKLDMELKTKVTVQVNDDLKKRISHLEQSQ